MFDRPKAGERCVLVHVQLASARDDLSDLKELAESAGGEVVAVLSTRRTSPDPSSCIGSGKLAELLEALRQSEADLVVFDRFLTPSQQRNLEKFLDARVVDRTGLILDIFAQRARSFEGKLQVELAQLRHMSTRLVRGWTHLERQKGGIGLRGPGETQLETDKRLIAKRIRQILKRLEKVEQHRDLGRQARVRNSVPVIGLVGYTNAGKSTLFNTLTRADVFSADQLFATLDPTLRRRITAAGTAVVLADTVGFIRDLPHELVAAFRSTLREAGEADLLLHVIDVSDEHHREKMNEVERVLREIGAEDVPRLEVFNKIDQIPGEAGRSESSLGGQIERVWLSAQTGQGIERLDAAFDERFGIPRKIVQIRVEVDEPALRAKLYRVGTVIEEQLDAGGGSDLKVLLPESEIALLRESGHVRAAKAARTLAA